MNRPDNFHSCHDDRRNFMRRSGAWLIALGTSTTPAVAEGRRTKLVSDLCPRWFELELRHTSQNLRARNVESDIWANFVASVSDMPEEVRVETIHGALNRIPYRSDLRTAGKSDFWSTPREFLSSGGDCEEFAAAKYFAMVETGIPHERLRFTLVSQRRTRTLHAIAEVRIRTTWYTLDNANTHPAPTAELRSYEPLLHISGTRAWLA